jgi:hypothetical protein
MDRTSIIATILGIFVMVILTSGTAHAGGSFGEYASVNACHCLMFNSTNNTQTWVLVNTFNRSLDFYIIKPEISNVSIITSITNGIIKANSDYFVNITAISHSAKNESGDILAYAVTSNATNSTGGESIRIGTAKLLEISLNKSITESTNSKQPPSGGNTNQSTAVITNAPSTNQKNSTTVQSTPTTSASSGATATPYLIAIIVILLAVICTMFYKVTKNKKVVAKMPRSNKNR